MPNEISDVLKTVSEFIGTYDDDEAVELVASLYLIIISLSEKLGEALIENKLLERDIKNLSEDEEINSLKESILKDTDKFMA